MKKQIEEEELTAWEHWIIRTEKNHNVIANNYDKLCDLVIFNFKLWDRSRKLEHQDRVMFFCRWWFKNKQFMRKYNSYAAIGWVLGKRDHGTILSHVKHRTPSYAYEDNVADLKDFLES